MMMRRRTDDAKEDYLLLRLLDRATALAYCLSFLGVNQARELTGGKRKRTNRQTKERSVQRPFELARTVPHFSPSHKSCLGSWCTVELPQKGLLKPHVSVTMKSKQWARMHVVLHAWNTYKTKTFCPKLVFRLWIKRRKIHTFHGHKDSLYNTAEHRSQSYRSARNISVTMLHRV